VPQNDDAMRVREHQLEATEGSLVEDLAHCGDRGLEFAALQRDMR
jgi:hypothetical protein